MSHQQISHTLSSRRLTLSFLVFVTFVVAAAACSPNGGNGGPPGTGSVLIQVEVTGPGAVEAAEYDFSCRGSCTLTVEERDRVTLEAVPDGGQYAVAWDGPCGALDERCEWVATEDASVGMAFAPNVLHLEVVGDGVGRFEIAAGDETTICRGSCGVGLRRALPLVSITYYPEESRTTLGPWMAECTTQTSRYCVLPVSELVTVGITWLHPPLAQDEDYITDQETVLEVAAEAGLLLNASDTPGDTLRATVRPGSEPQHGTLEIEDDGSFRYEPDVEFSGLDSFEYRVIDELGNYADATVGITVRPRLDLEKSGVGSGTVISDPAGIDCGPACQSDRMHVDAGQQVVLEAVPDVGSVFAGWGGACSDSGVGDTCAVVVDADAVATASVTASFARARHTLSVETAGPGFGNVSSSPTGIDVGAGQSSFEFEHGTEITLSAIPSFGSTFADWGGACSDSEPVCIVTITDDTSVTASFVVAVHTLTVAAIGSGGGNVVSDSPGIINLGAGLGSAALEHGTELSLTAAAGHGSTFAGWGGACTGNDPVCTLTVTDDSHVSATFTLQRYVLESTIDGSGVGRVTSSPGGINHTTDAGEASAEFDYGTPVSLTATPDTDSTFVGWGGHCSSFGSEPLCVITITGETPISARFGLVARTLTVQRVGTEGGNVVSYPLGINLDAGHDSAPFEHGRTVELTANVNEGWKFDGWGGECSDYDSLECSVEMTDERSVTATFSRLRRTVSSKIEGSGSGRVFSTPDRIDHSTGTVSAQFDYGTPITLTAVEGLGSRFAGWEDDCAGSRDDLDCKFTITEDTSVRARFDPIVTQPVIFPFDSR